MSNFLIYPQVSEEVGQQGQRNIVSYKSAVRKKFLNKYYLIPIFKSRAILSTSNVSALKIELMQELHEEAYQILCLQTFSGLALPQGMAAVLDTNQETEVVRVAKFYGLNLPQPEVLEEDGKGGVRVKVVKDKEVIPINKEVKPTLRPGAKKPPIPKKNVKEQTKETASKEEPTKQQTSEGNKAAK